MQSSLQKTHAFSPYSNDGHNAQRQCESMQGTESQHHMNVKAVKAYHTSAKQV